ncbi:MAG: hypothetical protein SGJ27_07020 [Candidatus Melainabacteria bacterium]|nr:hypothetical protein [Candidatus Melainabacteria bacterium]
MSFDPFDSKFNTVPPKPGTVAPPADGGDKTKTPPADTSDKAKPAGTTNFSPDNVFDDAYNLVPKPKDKTGEKVKPETSLDPKGSELNKVSDFPAWKQPARDFNQNGEVGKLFTDSKTGFVNGMQFTDGARKGQKYVFDRDDQGNINKIHMLMPGKDATPPQYLSFDKTDKGWVSKPAGQLVPGFKNLKVENGVISGDFKVNARGDFGYESADKQIRSVMRINGDKDHVDMKDYSRERELKNGEKTTTFWNGYDWQPGQKKQIADGVVRVDFQAQPGKPTSMTRDAKSDGFKVEFGTEKTQYTVSNWNEGKMTRQTGATADTLFATGVQDAQGKMQWRKGAEKVDGNQRVVTFNDAQDAPKVKAGELPQTSIINTKTGEFLSAFANGTKLAADGRGVTQKIFYNDKTQVDVLRDANNDFRGFRRSDGTTIYRGVDLSLAGNARESAWTVQRPGQQPIVLNGMLKHGISGAFSILNAGNEGLTVTPEGIMSTKLGGKVISDPPRPGDKAPAPVAPKDAPITPSPREVAPVKPGDRPAPEAPKPSDKVTPGKAPITNEQLKALSLKYKLDPKILVLTAARAERQGLHQTFTPENLEKLLQIADKHKLLSDFGNTADMSSRGRDGAIIGRLIPELLLDPTTAVDKAAAQTRETMAKSLRDGNVPQNRIDAVLQTVDRRYAELRANTKPFITELTKEFANRPAPIPTPSPLPSSH